MVGFTTLKYVQIIQKLRYPSLSKNSPRILFKSTPNARLAFGGLHRLSRIIQFQNQVVRRASGACPQKSDLIASNLSGVKHVRRMEP